MEILSSTLIDSNAGSFDLAVLSALMSVFFLIMSVSTLVECDEIPIASFFLVVAVVFGFLSYSGFTADHTSYKQHEVRITDMSKFDTEKYEIIEQRGKIFVVKEITKGDR